MSIQSDKPSRKPKFKQARQAPPSTGGEVSMRRLDSSEAGPVSPAPHWSEAEYRSVVENASEAIVVAQDGMLRFVNPKATEITGYSRGELFSRPFVEFIHPDDREMVVERYVRRLGGQQFPGVYSFRIVDKDGACLTNSFSESGLGVAPASGEGFMGQARWRHKMGRDKCSFDVLER